MTQPQSDHHHQPTNLFPRFSHHHLLHDLSINHAVHPSGGLPFSDQELIDSLLIPSDSFFKRSHPDHRHHHHHPSSDHHDQDHHDQDHHHHQQQHHQHQQQQHQPLLHHPSSAPTTTTPSRSILTADDPHHPSPSLQAHPKSLHSVDHPTNQLKAVDLHHPSRSSSVYHPHPHHPHHHHHHHHHSNPIDFNPHLIHRPKVLIPSPNPSPSDPSHRRLTNRPQNPFSPSSNSINSLFDEDHRSPSISSNSIHNQHSTSSQPIVIKPSPHSSTSFNDDLPSSSSIGFRPTTNQNPLDDDLSPRGSSNFPILNADSPQLNPSSGNHNHLDQQKLLLNEKRRKRRESHNAVERRRRDNINDRIAELASLLPTCLLDTVVSPPESGMMMIVNEEPPRQDSIDDIQSPHHSISTTTTSTNATAKPNKGVILAKSVDYIKHLKNLLDLQIQRNAELQAELDRLHASSISEKKIAQFDHNNDQDTSSITDRSSQRSKPIKTDQSSNHNNSLTHKTTMGRDDHDGRMAMVMMINELSDMSDSNHHHHHIRPSDSFINHQPLNDHDLLSPNPFQSHQYSLHHQLSQSVPSTLDCMDQIYDFL